MSNYEIVNGQVGLHEKTLAAGVEDTVTFPWQFDSLDIVLHSAASPVYYTLSGQPAVVKGEGCLVIPAASAIDTRRTRTTTVGRTAKLRLISAGDASYSVQYGG